MEPTGSAAADQRDHDIRTLLARLGAAMVATGQPVHEIEEELLEVGGHLGYPGVQVGAGPTSITVSMQEGRPRPSSRSGRRCGWTRPPTCGGSGTSWPTTSSTRCRPSTS